MTAYTAIPKMGKDIHFEAENDTEARHWVINHLDLSNEYTIWKINQ